MKKLLVLLLMLTSLAMISFADEGEKVQIQSVPIILPVSSSHGQNSVSAASRLYAQEVSRRTTDAERLVYHSKDQAEIERMQREILDRAVNAHPDPEVVRGIIESALTRGVVKSSFDTLTTYIDPIEGAENLKLKYGWSTPDMSVNPNYTTTFTPVTSSSSKAILAELDSLTARARAEKQARKEAVDAANAAEAARQKNQFDSIAAAKGTSKNLDDNLFKKIKIVDFTWSWVPRKKIALLIVLAPLFWLYRRMRWRFDVRKSTIQSQKDRINAAKIRKIIYEEEDATESANIVLSPSEIKRLDGKLLSFAKELAIAAEFNNRVLQQLNDLPTNKKDRESGKNKRRELEEDITAYNERIAHVYFEAAFEIVHPEFSSKISSKYPLLSEDDIRLCEYLYLGVPDKDMASLLAVDSRNVESEKTSLRKKLKIEAGQNFTQLFASM